MMSHLLSAGSLYQAAVSVDEILRVNEDEIVRFLADNVTSRGYEISSLVGVEETTTENFIRCFSRIRLVTLLTRNLAIADKEQGGTSTSSRRNRCMFST